MTELEIYKTALTRIADERFNAYAELAIAAGAKAAEDARAGDEKAADSHATGILTRDPFWAKQDFLAGVKRGREG